MPVASKAALISAGRRTKSNASTVVKPIAASRSSEPCMSAENSLASEYSCTEARGRAMILPSYVVVEGRAGRGCDEIIIKPPYGGYFPATLGYVESYGLGTG